MAAILLLSINFLQFILNLLYNLQPVIVEIINFWHLARRAELGDESSRHHSLSVIGGGFTLSWRPISGALLTFARHLLALAN